MSSFMYSWVSLSQTFMIFWYSKLWECMLQKPQVPTARISGDWNHTWWERKTSGYTAFGIFKRLWQTRALENKVQLWPILSCVVTSFLCPTNSVIKIHAYFYRWSRNFLPTVVFVFYFTSWYNSNILPKFGVSQYNSLSVQSWRKFQNENSFTRND